MDANIDEMIRTIEEEIKTSEKAINELRIYLRELRQLAKIKQRSENELLLLQHNIDVRNDAKRKLN